MKRVNDTLAKLRVSFFAPVEQLSRKRVLEIDILRSIAILLVLLYHAYLPALYDVSLTSNCVFPLVGVLGVVGLSIFFFVSGFSLYLSNNAIRNRRDALVFYKRRVARIYPLYWLFVVGILIVYRLSLSLGQTLIYFAGLQGLFYPAFISVPIYHFISVILIFYLLFPLIVFFEDYEKMLIACLIPLLLLVAIKLGYGQSDIMFLAYYGLFVGGIFAAKLNIHSKMRQASFRRVFVITLPLFVALVVLYLICTGLYSSLLALSIFINNAFGILMVLIIFYWAVSYVRVFNTRFYAFFTFIAFSTYGVFFLNPPFFVRLSATLNSRFHAPGTATTIVLVAFIPLLVMAGYLLQYLTNGIISFIAARKDD